MVRPAPQFLFHRSPQGMTLVLQFWKFSPVKTSGLVFANIDLNVNIHDHKGPSKLGASILDRQWQPIALRQLVVGHFALGQLRTYAEKRHREDPSSFLAGLSGWILKTAKREVETQLG